MKARRLVLIDNYDSFTYNLVYLLKRLGAPPIILHNDIGLDELGRHKFTHLLISPGHGSPSQSRICIEAIKSFAPIVPILGICLGHQCIATAFGGEVSPMHAPKHGVTSSISFVDNPLFKGLKQGLCVGLYHSLVVTKPGECEVLATSHEGFIMALKHKNWPCYGIQFHPESILQEGGKKILKNFLAF